MKYEVITTFLVLTFSFSFAHKEQQADYHFTKNAGQLHKKVKYHCKLHIGDVYFEKDQFTFDLYSAEDMDQLYAIRHNRESRELYGKQSMKLRKHAYSMQFLNANLNNSIIASEKEDFYKNYIKGSDSKKWYSHVFSYKKIAYREIYPKINMEVYGKDNSLKYDFIVKKGGDPEDIKILYKNVNRLKIEEGVLEIEISTGIVKELKPIAYQIINGEKHFVDCCFNVDGKQVTFRLPKGYNTKYQLIIDPTWVFSTLTGSSADNWGFTATYDENGNFYGGGIAFGNGYPTSSGAYDVTFGDSTDVVITKFNSSGTNIVYSTYIGGSKADQPHSLVTDADSNLIVLGVTSSSDFPTTASAYDQSFNGGTYLVEDGITYDQGTDIFVLKLNNLGSGLIASTFLGGSSNDGFSLNPSLKYNYADHARGEVILDKNEDICISSSTISGDFPTTLNSYSQTAFGGYDGVVAKLSTDLTSLMWSTYLGGTGGDAAYSIRYDGVNNQVFVCGGTTSNDLEVTTGVIGTNYSGAVDGFVAKFDDNNGAISALTYLGTTSYDQSYILEIDKNQSIYVVGQTKGNYPVSVNTYNNAGATQFIHKLDNNLTTSIFSTVFGSSRSTIDISLTAFLVDDCDNIYVGGWGGLTNNEGSTHTMPITSNAIQSSTDGSDFYFIVLDRDAQNLLYGTYFGSNGATEHVDGGTSRFNKRGTIYQAVCAACGGLNFPTSPGAYSNINGSSNCNFGAIKIELDFSNVIANVTPPTNQILCSAPYNITFSAGTLPPPNNYWSFGDGVGTATNDNAPTYTYANTGTYTVMYVAIDSSTCNIADTSYFDVHITQVSPFSATMSFNPPPCGSIPLTVQLNFTGSDADSLCWDMGDGTILTSITSTTYTYKEAGTYTVTLTAYNYQCNIVKVITNEISFPTNQITESTVPNIFTPNGDGINDEWAVVGVDAEAMFDLKIYNRWGRLVYQTDDPLSNWNGKVGGVIANEGTYFYHLSYKDVCNEEEKTIKGYISLLR